MNSYQDLFLKRPPSSFVAMAENCSRRASKYLYSKTTQLLIDAAVVGATLWLAYMIRFDGIPPEMERRQFIIVLPLVVTFYVGINVLSGLYKQVWRFVSLTDAAAMAQSVAGAAFVCVLWRSLDPGTFTQGPMPFGVLLIHPFLTFAALVGVRLTRRTLYQRAAARKPPSQVVSVHRQVLLVGSGEAGLQLLRQIKDTDFEAVGFLDDAPELQGRSIGGRPILGTIHELESVVERYSVDEVILCLPSVPRPVLQQIAARCAKIPVKASSVPTLWEIMSGNVMINSLRPVNMEALLGRNSVTYPEGLEELTRVYRGCRILVTGAGGSIGSELVRQLKGFRPSWLILLDKDENSLYETACEVREDFANLKDVVADIRDLELMEKVFEREKPDIVFHAAAYKHVPLMEHYPAEAVLNNVMGTRNIAAVSNRCGVKIFVLISTDKAVNPTSIMGASKRVAELLVQEFASVSTRTRFCCVRFGNVLGSRASVVPLFQRQIRQGKNITVTHPDVRRYFMTIPEAVQLVIQAGSLGNRGEIFLLDMGDPVKIVDLARNLIELSGLVPDKDVTIEFTGLRPGEKLDEELLNAGEQGIQSTRYSKICVVEALDRDWSELRNAVGCLEKSAHAGDADGIRHTLGAMNIGYHANHTLQEIPDEPTIGTAMTPARLDHRQPERRRSARRGGDGDRRLGVDAQA
jgi:FlaA1/EpsC-like NDP-sugar epimerase